MADAAAAGLGQALAGRVMAAGVGGRQWQLRPDLEVLATESPDGSPAILVHDPVSGDFDRVEWPESDLVELLREPRRMDEVEELFRRSTTLNPTRGDVASFMSELGKRGWLRGDLFWPAQFRERKRTGIFGLMARSLFIQIPLVKPERFLRATARLAVLLVNPLTMALLVLCGLAGLYLALPRWEDYWLDSFDSFSLEKAPAFLLALIMVKLIHELAHAYAATLSGSRVSCMGIAFFFFMPLPFTDVTDSWRLPWSKRIRIASAGMIAEMAVAGAALFLWALSPPGEAAATLARLSSVALLSTLATNLNPGPRFDGYYVLACLFRIENLRARGTALLRRLAWGGLFGIPLPDEESALGRRRRFAVMSYAVYAVFYRFSLGVALALMAYYMFPKAIGAPVAAVELWLFFGQPVAAECVRLWRSRKAMRATVAMAVSLLFLTGLGVWVCGTWPRRVDFPAVSRPEAEQGIRVLRSGVVTEISAGRGQRVEAGQVLAVLSAPAEEPLERQAVWALTEAEMAEEQSWRSDASRRETGWRTEETKRKRVELDALRQRSEYLLVRAPISGTLSTWNSFVEPGVSVAAGSLVGWVTDGPVRVLSCYPPVDVAGKLEPGAGVKFFPDTGEGFVTGTITRIEESRPEILEDAELAAALEAVPRSGAYILPKPYVKVEVRLDAAVPRMGQTGRVWVWTKPESLLDSAWRWLQDLAVRESAF